MDKMIEQKQSMKDFDTQDLIDLAAKILQTYSSDGGIASGGLDAAEDDGFHTANMSENTLQVCEMLGTELANKQEYETATLVYSLLLRRDQQPRYFIQRAECLRMQKLYVEAARDLAEASYLAPHMDASLSGQQYFEQIQHYYLDLDIKFW